MLTTDQPCGPGAPNLGTSISRLALENPVPLLFAVSRPRLPLAIAVVAAALLTVLLGAAPAGAHAVLTATAPERGATVAEQVDRVRLEFSEPVGFAQVQVTGPADDRVEEGTPVESGAVVEQPLAPVLEQGTYRVAFRVTSDDGHPVEGEFEFTYEGPVATDGTDDPPPASTDEPPPEDAGDGIVEEDDPVDAPEELPTEEAAHVDLGLPVLGVAVLALIAFAGAALFISRRRGGSAASTDDPRGE